MTLNSYKLRKEFCEEVLHGTGKKMCRGSLPAWYDDRAVISGAAGGEADSG